MIKYKAFVGVGTLKFNINGLHKISRIIMFLILIYSSENNITMYVQCTCNITHCTFHMKKIYEKQKICLLLHRNIYLIHMF